MGIDVTTDKYDGLPMEAIILMFSKQKPKTNFMITERPICFLDLETTGVDKENDRIVSICILKKGYLPFDDNTILNQLINPGIPIPPTVTLLHGITDDMVKDQPTFRDLANHIQDFIEGCDIAGFNSNNFDCPMLYYEFWRAGITWDYAKINFIDISNIYRINEPRTLAAAYQFYTGNPMQDAHNAKADIEATYEIYERQLDRYPDLPKDPKELALYSNYGRKLLDISGKFTFDEAGDVIFNFGKHKGKKAADERNYLDWMCSDKATFPPDVKEIAKRIWLKKPLN